MIKKDLSLERSWQKLLDALKTMIGKRPGDLNSVLFLIGVQELGKGKHHFSKEQKQDLMHIAICRILSASGFYELEGLDEEGWPHWKLVKPLPHFDLLEQEKLLKLHVIDYFKEEYGIQVDAEDDRNKEF
ncbi:hypothetical protein [Fulvivirga sedimenti]|jgi:hypothetical protein|uniref:Uncharacterized protein n=1 Tax=Fulvivirga sedimenti TaxID=2879465 RepID=A0A9X1HW78_9BACT|nr:hypothetical protein [Fulvivirga sedimenti]MCA6078520.1 hypothetical protein [Fulvivirga sedimenti]